MSVSKNLDKLTDGCGRAQHNSHTCNINKAGHFLIKTITQRTNVTASNRKKFRPQSLSFALQVQSGAKDLFK